MSAQAATLAQPARRGLSLVSLRDALLFIGVASSFFVMVEPSPTDLFVAIGLLVLLATGLHIPRLAAPLLWILLALNIGGAFSALPVMGKEKVATFVLISIFLMAYCVFFLVLASENTARRMVLLRRAWIFAAVVAAATGIVGYFGIAGTRDLFTLYASRAKGTFNDPNVLGPFLILPFLFLLQGFLAGTERRPLLAGAALLVIVAGLFLTFSRAAWGHAVGSVALLALLMFVTTTSTWMRTRITLALVAAILLVVVALAALAAIPEVRDMVLLRASLDQDYDNRYGGRFDNFRRGFQLILEHPNGMGPLEFGRRFGEDPHNAYLHTFIAYGWLGGIAYLTLVASTLWLGWRYVFARTPLQGTMIPVVACFTILAAMGFIIHTDHWRHFYLLVALVWALAAASHTHLAGARLRGPAHATMNPHIGV